MSREAPSHASFTHAVLDALPIAALVLDANDRILAMNRGAEARFGLARAEAVGRGARELTIAAGIARLRATLAHATTSQTPTRLTGSRSRSGPPSWSSR